jgi:hypothetical protein
LEIVSRSEHQSRAAVILENSWDFGTFRRVYVVDIGFSYIGFRSGYDHDPVAPLAIDHASPGGSSRPRYLGFEATDNVASGTRWTSFFALYRAGQRRTCRRR